MIKAIPLELSEANAFVDSFHRHHASVHRDIPQTPQQQAQEILKWLDEVMEVKT